MLVRTVLLAMFNALIDMRIFPSYSSFVLFLHVRPVGTSRQCLANAEGHIAMLGLTSI